MGPLSFHNIKKSYGPKEVLHGLSFDVYPGRPLAFLGRNGAGKTTAIRTLMQVFHQDSGEILLDGKPFDPNHHKIGYLPEERGMYQKIKIKEQLVYFARLRGASKSDAMASADKLLDRVGLSTYANSKLEVLSKGNQQKVQICQALLNDPDIIVLDEPFSGLDPVNASILMELIEETFNSEKLMFFSSHQMGYVDEICKDIVLLKDGQVVLSGALDEVQRKLGVGKLLLHVKATLSELQQLIATPFPHMAIQSYKQQFLVDLDGHDKGQFLRLLLDEGIDIHSFADYSPSIGEIFLHYVGDDHE